MGLRKTFGVLLVVALLRPADLVAQNLPVGDTFEEYLRTLQLLGEVDPSGFNLRPSTIPAAADTGKHAWAGRLARYAPDSAHFDFRVVDPTSHVGWAVSRPAGGNDGFLWQGRGLNTTWRAGVFARYAVITAALRPEIAFIQNADFEAGPGSPFHYLGRDNIDAPRRFGTDPLLLLHPGDSYVELSSFGASAGVSTANMWWGPAGQNAIIMSNNGPGFLHAYLKTSRPISAGIVGVNAKWIWGNLYESDFFDDNEANDRRFFTALVVDAQPRFIPNLYVGAARAFVQATDEEPTRFRDLFIVFQTPFKIALAESHDDFGFDKNDQVVSVWARWLFPNSGFGIYGEIGRGDHNWDLRHVFVQLKFSTAYTLGLNKVFRLSGRRLLRVNAEISRLEASKSDLIRTGSNSSLTNFYVNTIVRQGYTHRGQIIGAAIGPGSNSQHLSADFYTRWGKAGWYARRVVYDNDLFYSVSGDPAAHQVEFISGLNGVLFQAPFEITADFALRRFLNLYYERDHDEWNATVRVGARWTLGRHR